MGQALSIPLCSWLRAGGGWYFGGKGWLAPEGRGRVCVSGGVNPPVPQYLQMKWPLLDVPAGATLKDSRSPSPAHLVRATAAPRGQTLLPARAVRGGGCGGGWGGRLWFRPPTRSRLPPHSPTRCRWCSTPIPCTR